MRLKIHLSILFLAIVLNAALICAQQSNDKDPCNELRFLALMNKAPTIDATDIRKLPQCFNGKFIRLVGIYRIAFENSDLYDPTDENGRTWVTFDPFYSVVKRCSDGKALRLLNRKDGGTFGFVAMGIFHGPEPPKSVDPKLPPSLRERLERTPLGYGHLNSWPNEFQVICLEKFDSFSSDGSFIEFQKFAVRKRILDWYAKNRSR